MTVKRWLALLWICFVIRGLFSCTTLPLWEGLDEFAHFGFIQRVFYYHDLPDPKSTGLTREVVESMKATPLPEMKRDPKLGFKNYDEFWAGNPKPIPIYPVEWSRLEAIDFVSSYEAQQAPFYYWLMALVYWPIQGLDLVARVWILRCVNVMIGSLIIPWGFLIARRAFPDGRYAVAAVALFCSLPQLYMMMNHVGNEALAIPMATAIIALLLRWNAGVPERARHAAFSGLLFGIAMLTKAYMLTLIPAAAFVFVFRFFREKGMRGRVVRQFAIAVMVTFLVAGWWYWLTYLRTGSLSGEQTDRAAHAMAGTASLLQAAFQMPWAYALHILEMHNIFLGNWSLIVLSGAIYQAVYFPLLIAAVGLGMQLARPRKDLPRPRTVALLLVICGAFVCGLIYSELSAFVAFGNVQTIGCYFYATIAAASVLIVTGVARFLPASWGLYAITVICLAAAFVEVYGVVFHLLPYYAGLTHRLSLFVVERWPLAAVNGASIGQIIGRLAWNKPVAPGFIAILTVLWCAGMLTVLAIPLVIARRRPGRFF